MKISKDLFQQIVKLMIVAALLVLAVIYSSSFVKMVGFLVNMITPFLLGGAIAFVLNIPMSAIERKWLKGWTGTKAERFRRPASMVLTILIVFAVIGLLFATVVPKLSETVAEIAKQMPAFLDQLSRTVAGWNIPGVSKYAQQGSLLDVISKNWDAISKNLFKFLQGGTTEVIGQTVHVVTGIIGAFATGIIGFVFALYVLGQKEKLGGQFSKLFKAYLPEKGYSKLIKVLRLLSKNFKSFITGQCLDASILGALFVVMMFLLRIPYALMIGVVIAFTALIPIIGAFLGCFVGVFLIGMEDPSKVVWFLVLFIILQQTEGKLIYPRVVGGSVGLPAIWTLFAVFVGGSLFGVVGMLAFIPLLSTVYALLRDDVNRRVIKKS
ncbi:MAG: AI-2E family transporter [Clostridiales bacterium]|nr:AI-2E family transporter [Candidatus Crickella merdequi]